MKQQKNQKKTHNEKTDINFEDYHKEFQKTVHIERKKIIKN